ncbi:MAG: hypothetical protein KDK91_29020 [Gammaproteobacteria bacterium]|nr:hypothetical protein [Gammaproteobacteria bacterium]
METEQFAPHVLGTGLGLSIALDCLEYKEGILRLHLSAREQQGCGICLQFSDALYFSVSDEGDRMRSLRLVSEIRSSRLFTAEHSTLLDWFLLETFSARSKDGLTHYVLLTEDEWVDVLSLSEPTLDSDQG